MPETKPLPVVDLSLDLRNYRTIPQPSEIAAIDAMISTRPEYFWALTGSLLRDGYLPTENVLVLRPTPRAKDLVVREGNRRVAAMKLLHGLIPIDKLTAVPVDEADRVKAVTQKWRNANKEVPCTVYKSSEASVVDRIVTLTHGKGEKAGRDQWNTVARARHSRDELHNSEPALDVLEKYLKQGQNITDSQRARWAGDFPLSVLAEALKRVAPRAGLANSVAIGAAYPKVKYRAAFEKMIHDVGLENLNFDKIRSKLVDFAVAYGFPAAPAGSAATGTSKQGSSKGTAGSGGTTGTSGSGGANAASSAGQAATASNDLRSVKRLLKTLQPKGKSREKLVALRDETLHMNVQKTPMAFTFVLRSMFEIAAKAYCDDHKAAGGPSASKANGDDRHLVDVLRDVEKHLTKNGQDRARARMLHGAMAELGTQHSFLSVASLNQLIHNPRFSIAPGDVAIRFGNVFPLLEAMSG